MCALHTDAEALDFVRRRYRHLAGIYPLFNLVLALPPHVRARAIDRLALKTGATVLEVGCGTGANLGLLEHAVGASGKVIGIDCSDAMLARASARCRKRRWDNVTLLAGDAAAMAIPSQVDGVLFSVSYTVMPNPQEALRRAWGSLRQNGSVVILDGRFPGGPSSRFTRWIVEKFMDMTVLGKLDRRPWKDLERFTSFIEVEELHFGYYICRGAKSEA